MHSGVMEANLRVIVALPEVAEAHPRVVKAHCNAVEGLSSDGDRLRNKI
jgi:hypothetical protein